MLRLDARVPFVISSSDLSWQAGSGLADLKVYYELPIAGILRVEDEALCFQIKRKATPSLEAFTRSVERALGKSEREAEQGSPAPQIEDVCVPLAHLMSVTFKRARWFDSRLTLEANDLRAFESIPGGMGTRLAMRIKKRHADLAEGFVSRLQLWLSERALRNLDDDLN